MPGIADVLLFEGIPRTKGGSAVRGSKCLRKKRVRSASGKMIERCAKFSGGGGLAGLGALPFDVQQLQNTLITGGVAVGGAVFANKTVGYLAPMIKVDPGSNWIMLMEVIVGLVAGYAVGKYAKQPDLGAAVALGPVIVNGLRVVGMFLAPSNGIAGSRPNVRASRSLGAVVPGGQLPEWMFQSEYMNQINQQVPAWTTG